VDVLVVDDQPAFRAVARALVSVTPDLCLVAEAETGEQAVDVATLLRPSVVLMDVNLPGIDGIEATRRLRAGARPPVVILLSTYDEDQYDLADCGAASYIAKAVFGPDRLSEAWDAAGG